MRTRAELSAGTLTRLLAAFLAAFAISSVHAAAPAAPPSTVTVKFKEVDTLFANPGKGWMSSARTPPKEMRLPYSVAYIRFCWMDLEPQEGQYNWKLLDEPIAAWAKVGGRISLRIMTASAHTKGYYCSPKWLFEAGCKSYDYNRGGGDPMAGGSPIPRIEPDYSDPIFLQKHGRTIAELGKRYDGTPGLEFVDIGSYGIWGEWHTKNGKPWEVRRQIIDMYLSAFKKTPLVQMSDDAEAMAYSLAHGTGFRRDGVGSIWHEQNWIGSKKYAAVKGFEDQWTRAPVVFEWFGPHDYLKSRNWPFDKAVEFMLKNHVTWINDNIGKVPESDWPQMEKLARLSGYRFVLREMSQPTEVSRGQVLRLTMKWANVGVGKLYRNYPLALFLLDSEHKPVASAVQKQVDVTTWLPGNFAVTAQLPVPPSLSPGEYTLAVALLDPMTEKPAICIAIDVPEEGRVHRIGRITVK